ncbi:hypothetical protein PTSG_06810 [Salpingoeca rosetta]|uniref:C-terminal of Roc (COR) domain-containing protein n=1 Tax=Salpingoeca rosetta (strain ATCC 50818 / BSB-021) TaxID=946362 RepID=F2UEV6_SALR5|nr:uncharacterized protein PTSG_06810 [Salpingoeca rosetta]EGD75156.1 hypothetical protein PTSG_06810 [Salpingoeca rosetta]|eukprot:XP_004992209.1 hypothetical protein PTSG_06810 [Salpingoeca rosetta]
MDSQSQDEPLEDDTFPDWFQNVIQSIEDGSCGDTVNLTRAKLSQEMCQRLAAALLKTSYPLKTLTLARNHIGPEDMKALAPALGKLQSLQSLSLSANNFGPEEMKVLAPALEKLQSLQSLDLSDNQIRPEGMRALAPALKNLKSLQSLSLRYNQIGSEGMKALAPALENLKSLQSLDLSGNSIGPEGMKALAPALGQLQSLQSLSLARNHIGPEGMKALAPALEQLKSLQSLSLSGNDFGPEGMKALAPSLGKLQNLQSLDLDSCGITVLTTDFLHTEHIPNIRFGFDPIAYPPPSIITFGRPAIYAYLRDVQRGHELLTRSRLVFIGDGGVGKTTLKTALLMLHNKSKHRTKLLKKVQGAAKAAFKHYTEADFRHWIDKDLAQQDGFFDKHFLDARDVTGDDFLTCSKQELKDTIFCSESRGQAVKRVQRKLADVHRFLLAEDVTLHLSQRRPFQLLLQIPHVWTEGVHVDEWRISKTHHEDDPTSTTRFDLWDFAGQLEFFPAHQLFMASHMAVYILVFDASKGFKHAHARIRVWLDLLEACLPYNGDGAADAIQVRLVATKTDCAREDLGLQHLLQTLQRRVGKRFDLGSRCFATRYNEPDGGDLTALDAELWALRKQGVPYFQVPKAYMAIKEGVEKLARHKEIDVKGKDRDLILGFLQDAGVVRRIPSDKDECVVKPVTWLSKLMASILHPLHGLKMARAADDSSDRTFLPGVEGSEAASVLSCRDVPVPVERGQGLLPFLASFGVCFPLDGQRYTFPALLPRARVHGKIVERLNARADAHGAGIAGRRLQCLDEQQFLPPTCWPAVVKGLFYVVKELNGDALHLSKGIFVAKMSDNSYLATCVTDVKHRRALDVVAVGADSFLLHLAMLVVVDALHKQFPSLRLQKRCLLVAGADDHEREHHVLLKRAITTRAVHTAVKSTSEALEGLAAPAGVTPQLHQLYVRRLEQSKLVFRDRDSGSLRLVYFHEHWLALLTDPELVKEKNIPEARQTAKMWQLFADVEREIFFLSDAEMNNLATRCGMKDTRKLDGLGLIHWLKSNCPKGSNLPYLSPDSDLEPLRAAAEGALGERHNICVNTREWQRLFQKENA